MNATCPGCGTDLPPKNKHAGRDRKWCSERCRKGQYAGTCVDCGKPTNGQNGPEQASERCLSCWLARSNASRTAHAEQRMREAVTLRREGLRNAEIAARMDTTTVAVTQLIHRAKLLGWDVPRDLYMTNRRGLIPAAAPAPPHAGSTLDTPARELLSSHGSAVETTLNTSNARQGPGVA